MKRSERIRIAHEACEMLETGQNSLSCIAIASALGDSFNWEASDYYEFWLRFFGRPLGKGNFNMGFFTPASQHHRIMNVLAWAYMPDSARKGIV